MDKERLKRILNKIISIMILVKEIPKEDLKYVLDCLEKEKAIGSLLDPSNWLETRFEPLAKFKEKVKALIDLGKI